MPEYVWSLTLKIPQSYSRRQIAPKIEHGTFVKIFNRHYEYIFEIPGIENVLNICEYALEQCLNMLEYMPESEPKITLQVT